MTNYLWIVVILIIFLCIRKKRRTAAAVWQIQNRRKQNKEILVIKELAKQFIGEECIIYTITSNDGMEGVRAVELPVGEKIIRVGVVHGLKNARQLIAKMEAGEEHIDLVEVMTCTNGCVGGAGQPRGLTPQKQARAEGLYEADRGSLIKSSQANPILKTLYEKLPPEKAHELLHVHYPQPEKMI